MKVNFGSRDSVAQRAAGVTAAQNIPQFITRTRQVAVAPAAVASRAASPVIAAIASSYGGGGGGNGGGSGGSSGGSFAGASNAGRTYNVGQVYESGDGRQLRANSDGSFTNTSTGQKSVGSSKR